MKWTLFCVAILVLGLAVGSQAATTFYLYEYNTSNTAGSVFAGGTFDFWVQMVTTGDVVSSAYNVVLPPTNWTLNSRNYGTYGWNTDGTITGFDTSVPLQTASGYPYTVTNALYPDTAAVPDFRFSSARNDFVEVSGTVTMERFTLGIPTGTTLGTYDLSLFDPVAYDMDGLPSDSQMNVGDTFRLTVGEGAIPEPATMGLFGLGLIGLALLRKRRAA